MSDYHNNAEYDAERDNRFRTSGSNGDDNLGLNERLQSIENYVNDAKNYLFSQDKCVIDRTELLNLVKMCRNSIPEEIDNARYILLQGQNIVNKARQDAQRIVSDAKAQQSRLIDESEIVEQANGKAELILEDASQRSSRLQQDAREYAIALFKALEDHLSSLIVDIQNNREKLNG